jgi:hypothetical protein
MKRMNKQEIQNLQQSLNNFINSKDFRSAMLSVSKASWADSGHLLELFENSYRVLSNNSIVNRYETRGLIIGLPFFSVIQENFDTEFEINKAELIDSLKERFQNSVECCNP